MAPHSDRHRRCPQRLSGPLRAPTRQCADRKTGPHAGSTGASASRPRLSGAVLGLRSHRRPGLPGLPRCAGRSADVEMAHPLPAGAPRALLRRGLRRDRPGHAACVQGPRCCRPHVCTCPFASSIDRCRRCMHAGCRAAARRGALDSGRVASTWLRPAVAPGASRRLPNTAWCPCARPSHPRLGVTFRYGQGGQPVRRPRRPARTQTPAARAGRRTDRRRRHNGRDPE